MEVVIWSLILGGASAVLTGRWIAFWGRVPLDDDRGTLTEGMRRVGPFMSRSGLIAAVAGGILLLVSLITG